MALTSLLLLERGYELGPAIASPRLHHQLSPMVVEHEGSLSQEVTGCCLAVTD